MEKLMEAVINLASADPTKPLTPERRNHIEQRLHQLFPVLHTPSHPAYAAMIHRAIVELNEEEGSSEESISGFIKREYDDLPWAHAILLSHHLGKLTEKGEIVVTGNNCYMIPVVNPNFEVQNVDQEESQSLEQDSQVNEGHPNLEARGRKRKCGRGRRHEEYEIVEEEEESQSHEQQSELNEEKTNLEARGRKRKHGRGICSTENQIVVEAEEEEEEEELTEEKPNLEARGWKQKRGRGRRRRANENVVEEEIQSRSKVKAEKNREKGEIEVVEEQSQLERPQIEVIEGVNQHEIKIEASAEQNQPTGQPCELIEEQNRFLGEKSLLVEERNQVKDLQSEVIGEQNDPQEQRTKVRIKTLRSCHDGDGDTLMVQSGGSPRLLVEEDMNKSSEEEEQWQTEKPCGERVVEQQIQPKEQDHEVIDEQFQLNEHQVGQRSKIKHSSHDGDCGGSCSDALMVLSSESCRPVVEKEKNESLEEDKQQQTGSLCGERESVIEVIEEPMQPQEKQQEVIDEQFQPNEHQVEERSEIKPSGGSCSDTLMVLSSESCRPVVEEEKNESIEEEDKQQQAGSPCGGREFVVGVTEEQMQQQEQQEVIDEHDVINEQFQPNEHQVEERSEIKSSGHDGECGGSDSDSLMVLSRESPRPVVEEKKNESLEEEDKLLEEEDKQQQTGSPCGEREFVVGVIEERIQPQEQQQEQIEEGLRPNEQEVEVRGKMLPSCHDVDCDEDDLVVPLGESHMPVVEEEKNESLAEEKQQHQTKSPRGSREFVVEVIKEKCEPEEHEVTEKLKQPEEQQNEVIEEQVQLQEEQIEERTQLLQPRHDVEGGDCNGNDLWVQLGKNPKPLMEVKKESLKEEKQQETKAPCEGKEIVVGCCLTAQQLQQQQAQSGQQTTIMEETSQTMEKQPKRRGRKKRPAPQPTTVTTSLDSPLALQQLEPEQQQEFLNQERPLERKRKRVEENFQRRQLRPRGPPNSEPATSTTMETLLPLQDHHKQQEQPQRKGRGRPPKPKPGAETTMWLVPSDHDQHQPQHRGRGRPPKPKPEADTTGLLPCRGRGRPPKSRPDADTNTEGMLTSHSQQQKPKHQGVGRPPRPKPDANSAIMVLWISHNQQEKPKRDGRGRPPKAKPDANTTIRDSLISQNQQQQSKRRGRPPKLD